MNCDQSLLELYADGELDAARVLELEQHLRECPACAATLARLQSLQKTLRKEEHYFPAPAALRSRVLESLRDEVGDPTPRKAWNWSRPGFFTASGLAAACLAALLTVVFTQPSSRQMLEREVVASHIRSLMASHALDVVSTDQHTVKPWFDGKLDFSPPVRDLTPQGFPLLGGRLDYLKGHPVAAIVCQRRKHVINLFIWPDSGADVSPTLLSALEGYNVVHWSRGGMVFWAVSDVAEGELLSFAKTWESPETEAR